MSMTTSIFSSFKFTPKELESIGSYSKALSYTLTESEKFIILVAKQSGVLPHNLYTPRTALIKIEKVARKVRKVCLSDINMDEKKFKTLSQYFPYIYHIDVKQAKLYGTLICTPVEVLQYFPCYYRITVSGTKENTRDLIELSEIKQNK